MRGTSGRVSFHWYQKPGFGMSEGLGGGIFDPKGGLISLLPLAAVLFAGAVGYARIEAKLDHEADLRGRLEKVVADQMATRDRQDARIEVALARLTEDMTAVRIRLGVMRDSETPASMRGQPAAPAR